MTLKQKALAHYDRMIEWAEKQPKRNKRDSGVMYASIREDWGGTCCPYCQKMYEEELDCSFCRLRDENYDEAHPCCGGKWIHMASSATWGTWVKRARKVREYIEKHG